MSDPDYWPKSTCPDCGHNWRAHQGRNGAERCVYTAYADYRCPCRRKNPDIEAEDRRAADLWNMYMGRDSR